MNLKADRRDHFPAVKILTKTLRIMRITAFFLLVGSLTVSAHGWAQERVTLHLKGASLKTVLDKIQEQTGYTYLYSVRDVPADKRFDVNVRDVSIRDVLDECLKGTPLRYEIVDRLIKIIAAQNPPRNEMQDPSPGAYEVTIVVSSEDGVKMAGATVKIAGAKFIGETDGAGNLVVKSMPKGKYEIVVSYVGYQVFEGSIVVEDKSVRMPVFLKHATNHMDEVQIVAYGQTTERLSTGDVSTVSGKTIQEQPVSNPILALEGRVPGIFVSQNTGVSGGTVSVSIRGTNSISNGNNPFYVVDGVPYTSTLLPNLAGGILATDANGTSGSPFDYINPSDIESISILKDADATAIYGSRAANGAILITTKKAKIGKPKVEINVYSGTGRVPMGVTLMNNAQYLEMRHEAFVNDGITPNPSNAPDILVWDTTRYTNWQKVFLGGIAHIDDANATFSGGNLNTKFLLGGGYHKESSVFPFAGANQKGSVHLNFSNVSDDRRFQTVVSASYSANYNNLPTADLTQLMFYTPPDAPNPVNPDGSLNWANGTWPINNPFAAIKQAYMAHTYNLISNAVLSYNICRGFDVKSSFGYTNMQIKEVSTIPINSQNPAYSPVGYSNFANNNIQSWIIEPQATYSVVALGGKLDILGGATFQQNTADGLVQGGSGYTSDALLTSVRAAPTLRAVSETQTTYKYNALFGRLSYNLKDEYLVDVNFRRDGSSRFGPDKQFHDFSSVGAAWIFTKRQFFSNNMSWLSFGKIKASYGTTGNDQIGDYQFYDLFYPTYFPYQGLTALTPSNLYNPELSWEETKKWEGSISLGFLKDRILISPSYYFNRTSNELISYTLPMVTGFNSILSNFPATVRNYGLELQVNTVNIRGRNFRWSSSFNLTVPKNKLVSFPNLANSSYAHSLSIGHPLSDLHLYHCLGVNDTTGIYEFAGDKGGPTTMPSPLTDKTVLVDMNPAYYGGFENDISYKGFTLDFLFQFVKRKGTNLMFLSPITPGFDGFNRIPSALNRWRQPGDKASLQLFTENYASPALSAYNSAQQSDLAITDASFVRLKNVSLTYQFPDRWVKTMHLQELRAFVRGQNLFTITKYNGLDPENPNSTALPLLRVVAGGIQISL